MSATYRTLVFCDNCAALAVAELDRAPLCMSCLLEELKRGEPQHQPATHRISPLGMRRASMQRNDLMPPAEVA